LIDVLLIFLDRIDSHHLHADLDAYYASVEQLLDPLRLDTGVRTFHTVDDDANLSRDRALRMRTVPLLSLLHELLRYRCAVPTTVCESRTGWTLDCHFVEPQGETGKFLRPSSLSRPVDTARAVFSSDGHPATMSAYSGCLA
jgi:hypothetical protein